MQAAIETVWLVGDLLRWCRASSPALDRLGELTLKDQRLLAEFLGGDNQVLLALRLAETAGLIVPDNEVMEAPGIGRPDSPAPHLRLTAQAANWQAADLADRWAWLTTGPDARDEAARRLREMLPSPASEIILQGDLTGVIPGLPSAALSALIEQTAELESRGAATTVRFTAASVRRALTGGMTADDLLADLTALSPVPVPQPLTYLVRDEARKMGDAASLLPAPHKSPSFAQDGVTVVEPVEAPGLSPAFRVMLREAMREGTDVWLTVTGHAPRRVTPLRYAAGRLRVLDPEREVELTVSARGIARLEPIDA